MAVPPTATDIAGQSPTRVLVVDDEASIRSLLTAILAPQGYEVTVACDGDEAKLFLDHVNFEVVVTDYLIPGRLNGIDVLRLAKRVNAACQVVVITGNHGDEVQEKAIRFGASDYIPKPFFPEDLVASVKIQLEVLDPIMRDRHRADLMEARRRLMQRRARG